HLFDRFLAPLLGQCPVAPVVEQPIVQPILIDGGHLVAQGFVEIFDDLGVALHGRAPTFRSENWKQSKRTAPTLAMRMPAASRLTARGRDGTLARGSGGFAAGAAAAHGTGGGTERLVHDALDGSRAASALRAAAEAAVDLARSTWCRLAHGVTHVA